ncbi:MAG: protein kinase [Thermodesulfobacteriota bacterium]
MDSQFATICPSCMHEKGASNLCSLCGFDESGYEDEPIFLRRRATLLKGRYVIGLPLGKGGFGITYIGLDTVMRETVAIKEFMPTHLVGRHSGDSSVTPYTQAEKGFLESGLRRFIGEARKLVPLRSHPHVVSVLNFFEENNTAYLVMEYLPGQDLGQYLKSRGGRIGLAEALEIILPVMDALSTAHDRGIWHLDVSAQNIRLTGARVPVLIDFGAAKLEIGEKSRSMEVVVKPGYSPLEQYSARGALGPWSDIYALGATMFLMLTGELPPDATDRFFQDDVVPLSRIPELNITETVSQVLLRAIAIGHVERYQSVAEFREALLSASRAGAAKAATPGPPPEPPRVEATSKAPTPTLKAEQRQAYPPPSPPEPAGAKRPAPGPPSPPQPPLEAAPPPGPPPAEAAVSPPPRPGRGRAPLYLGLAAVLVLVVGAVLGYKLFWPGRPGTLTTTTAVPVAEETTTTLPPATTTTLPPATTTTLPPATTTTTLPPATTTTLPPGPSQAELDLAEGRRLAKEGSVALGRGDLAGAEALLAQARTLAPEEATVKDLAAGLDKARAREQGLKLAAEGGAALARGDLEEAGLKLAEAEKLAPGEQAVLDLAAGLAAARRLVEETKEGRRLAAEGLAALDRGDLPGAETLLAQAEEHAPADPAVLGLADKIEAARKEARDVQEAKTLAGEGLVVLEKGDLEGALAKLEAARNLAPREPEVKALADAISLAQAAARARELAGEGRAALDAGDLETAGAKLAEARKLAPEEEAVIQLADAIENAAKARQLAEEGLAALAKNDPDTARQDLAEAKKLAPEAAPVKELEEKLAELDKDGQAEKDAEARRLALAGLAALDKKHLKTAKGYLYKARQVAPDEQTARTLAYKIRKYEEEQKKSPPEPAKTATGTLNIFSSPWGNIYINGKSYGRSPKSGITLPAGTYQVTVVFGDPSLGKKSAAVTIQPGKTSRLSLKAQ